jgi:hypothetical protein
MQVIQLTAPPLRWHSRSFCSLWRKVGTVCTENLGWRELCCFLVLEICTSECSGVRKMVVHSQSNPGHPAVDFPRGYYIEWNQMPLFFTVFRSHTTRCLTVRASKWEHFSWFHIKIFVGPKENITHILHSISYGAIWRMFENFNHQLEMCLKVLALTFSMSYNFHFTA